jgi:hypothetical protein
VTRPADEPHGAARLPGGKIRIPFTLAQPGVIADGMRVIGPDDPRYADYDEWLAARDAQVDDAGSWTVAGEVPDSGEQVTLTWRDGIDGWPADALDWALAAATAGEVQLDDGAALHGWLLGQGFADTG